MFIDGRIPNKDAFYAVQHYKQQNCIAVVQLQVLSRSNDPHDNGSVRNINSLCLFKQSGMK